MNYFRRFIAATEPVIQPEPKRAIQEGFSPANNKPQLYPATTPTNVRMLKITVVVRGML